MDYFVNTVNQLEEDINKNHSFDYDLEEITCIDFEDYFYVPNSEVFYTIIDQDNIELVRILENSASSQLVLTDTMSLMDVDDVKFLLFDLVEICILIINKVKKEDLNNLINSII